MDSLNLIKESVKLYQTLIESDSDKISLLDKLFENLITLKNKHEISFDLESLSRISPNDLKFDKYPKDFSETSLNIKKCTKKLFNLSLLQLIEKFKDENSLDFCLDRLVELLDLEYSVVVEVKNEKNVEFIELFLVILFFGSSYHLGLIQHFLLNSKYNQFLPNSLNNLTKNFERTNRFNLLLNPENPLDSDLFYERFLIFITKLNTPDVYGHGDNKLDKMVKIPKKELALKNPSDSLESTNQDNNSDMEEYSDDEDEEESESSEHDDEFYCNNYVKLWENILGNLVYSLNDKCLVILLESLPKFAFPFVYNPLKIANFLYKNLINNNKDLVINSLNCLFELILYYKLTDQMIQTQPNDNIDEDKSGSGTKSDEFHWFYQKLYDIMEFEYLSSSSRVVLIPLTEKALNSSMLPNNLISLFIKKLLKVSTLLEINICNCLLIISFNLLQKHYRNLLFLIHSPQGDYNHGSHTNLDEQSVDFENLNKSQQLFLHELYLLLNHFNNDTAKIVGVFFTDLNLRNRISFNVKDFLHPQNNAKLIEKSKSSNLSPFKISVQNTTSLSRMFFP